MNSIGQSVWSLRIAMAMLTCGTWTACGQTSVEQTYDSPSQGLVFVRVSDGDGRDLFRARIADAAVRRLTDTPEILESNPVWLPSVLRVLYVGRFLKDPRSAPRLMMQDPRTGTADSVGATNFLREQDASVSADGKLVAYVFEAPPGVLPSRGVRVVSPMTGRHDLLGVVPNASGYLSPRFSPEGGSVVAQVRDAKRGDGLWLLESDGGGIPLVSNPRWNDTDPRFAQLGGSIYFNRSFRRRTSKAPPLGGGDVCRVHLPSLRVDCVVQSEEAREYAVEPSPTRAEMLFVRETDAATELFLAGLQGENERQLTHSPSLVEQRPVWSPDGDRIVYVDGSESERRLVVIDRQGTVLFETPGDQPAWAPAFAD
jgi:Tol biopolymer transport system component